jgi:hypothetical protein
VTAVLNFKKQKQKTKKLRASYSCIYATFDASKALSQLPHPENENRVRVRTHLPCHVALVEDCLKLDASQLA